MIIIMLIAVLNCCAGHLVSVDCFWITTEAKKKQVAELNIAPAPTSGSGT